MIKWSWHIIQLIAIITICHCKLTAQTNTDSLVIEYQIADDESLVPDREFDSFEPPIASLNYLLETATPIDQGKLYYQNILLFGQRFGYGLTDAISIIGGTEFVSLFQDETPTVLIGPKFSFSDRYDPVKVAVGANFFAGSLVSGGTIYGVVTVGNLDNNLSAGINFGYDRFEFFEIPLIQISGKVRLTKNVGLVLDSASVLNSGDFSTVPTFFIRFMSHKLVFDIGVGTITDGSTFPLANFAIQLN